MEYKKQILSLILGNNNKINKSTNVRLVKSKFSHRRLMSQKLSHARLFSATNHCCLPPKIPYHINIREWNSIETWTKHKTNIWKIRYTLNHFVFCVLNETRRTQWCLLLFVYILHTEHTDPYSKLNRGFLKENSIGAGMF